MNNIPIIRLEVEGMKYSILHAFQQHTASMDSNIQAALEAYCKPEHIDFIIQREATAAIDQAVKEEVRNFFQYSKPGRLAVREAVLKYLNDWDAAFKDD